jgi:hypothetical protein
MRVPSVKVGEPPSSDASPDAYLTVTVDREATLRMDIYAEPGERQAFTEVLHWGGLIAVGFGEKAYFLDLQTRTASVVAIGSYFSRFYPTAECLLVASGAHLTCVGLDGELLWTSSELGTDGIVVDQIRQGAVRGEGLYQKPSRWQAFLLDTVTGKSIE